MPRTRRKANTLTFVGSIAPIMSAMQASGNGDGLRIKIDIPETEKVNALPLVLLNGKVLRFTIEEVEEIGGTEQADRGAAPSPLDLAGGGL